MAKLLDVLVCMTLESGKIPEFKCGRNSFMKNYSHTCKGASLG